MSRIISLCWISMEQLWAPHWLIRIQKSKFIRFLNWTDTADSGVTFLHAQYSAPTLCNAKQEVEFMYNRGCSTYKWCTLQPRDVRKWVCERPLCALEYGRAKECYTGIKQHLYIHVIVCLKWGTSCLFPHDQVSRDRFRKPTLKFEFFLNVFIEFTEFSD